MPGRRPQVMMLQAEGVAIDSCLVGHSMFVCQWWIAQKNNHHIILYDHGKKKKTIITIWRLNDDYNHDRIW